MMAFIKQSPDLADLMNLGDFCFLWLWERRAGTDKGVGAQCLGAALGELKKRFRGLKTLIVNLQPGQFAEWVSKGDPTSVAEAKESAFASTKAYLQHLTPQAAFGSDAQLRIINSKFLSPDETMLQLGLADVFDNRRF